MRHIAPDCVIIIAKKLFQDVGIIFASLVNFNELYDESYMGGKEFLR